MDRISTKERSENMRRIKSENTQPEIAVRKLLHAMGYRFRLHRKELPGTPDLVLPGSKSVIFVHGCFWHRHIGCPWCYTPKTKIEFWKKKFEGNVARDKRVQNELARLGWSVFVVWECEVANLQSLKVKLKGYLDS